ADVMDGADVMDVPQLHAGDHIDLPGPFGGQLAAHFDGELPVGRRAGLLEMPGRAGEDLAVPAVVREGGGPAGGEG
ncbi:MAG: hypothetical protein ACYCXN_03720, partial [Acidimicrobiales bacterium]